MTKNEETLPDVQHSLLTHRADVLLATVNSREHRAMLSLMTPRDGCLKVETRSPNRVTYWIGKIGRFTAALVKSEMGSLGRDAAAATIADAIQEVHPRAVVAVGVAFGSDPTKQRLGQVLISRSIISYEQYREGAKREWRGGKVEPGPRLRDRFSAALESWNAECPPERKAKLGPLLSGEKLIDDPLFKQELLDAFPDAIGGEMEGVGVYGASSRHEVEWIVVKAICDWADGSKKDDDVIQEQAAANAAGLVLRVFQAEDALNGFQASRAAPNVSRAVEVCAPPVSVRPAAPIPSEPVLAGSDSQRRVAKLLEFAGEYSKWTPGDQARALAVLKEIAGLRDEVNVAGPFPGSVLLLLKLSEADSARLDSAFKDGRLQSIGVRGIVDGDAAIAARIARRRTSEQSRAARPQFDRSGVANARGTRFRWRGLELPTRVVTDSRFKSDVYGRFTVEPFEMGLGTAVGNGLRRVLLSSLEGAAVTSIKIKGAPHEFSSLPGVLEDVTDIVLQVKNLIVRLEGDEPKILKLAARGPGEITAGMIESDASVVILNRDLVIATLTDKVDFEMELTVAKGRGYVPADAQHESEDEQVIGRIHLDAVYSPVQRVRYKVEGARVGTKTNYEMLTLEIWTNGTVSPDLALAEAAKIFRKHLNPIAQCFELLDGEPTEERSAGEARASEDDLIRKLNLSINDMDLSVRASNCLESAGIESIAQLVELTDFDLLRLRSFGRTSLREVKRKLEDLGLSLGMKLPERVRDEVSSRGRTTSA